MSDKNLDRQFDYLPDDVVFCKNCVVSNQRPRITFDKNGICSACQWAFEKDNIIDWDKRESELIQLLDSCRSNDGSFDVVVPGSGGKDSVFVAHQLKHRYNMNPICVTWAPFEYTDIGWKNLHNFVMSGFNNIIGQPDGMIHRKLARLALKYKGDAWEPFAYGQMSWALHIAKMYNVKLIIYGENGDLEYGGSDKLKYKPNDSVEDWEEIYYKSSGIDELVELGIQDKIFSNGEFNITFEEGSFNFDNSFINNEEFLKLHLSETSFLNENEKIYLLGSLELDIYDINQFYRTFPIKKSKKLKREIKKIKFNFSFNLSNSQFLIDKISFIGKNNKVNHSQDVDNIVEDNYKTSFSLSNPILFKNFMKKVLTAYLDEG